MNLEKRSISYHNEHIMKNFCNGLFQNKSKPISYIKGDLVCLDEIYEDQFAGKLALYYQNSSNSMDNKKSNYLPEIIFS